MSFFQVTSQQLRGKADELSQLNRRFAAERENLVAGEQNLSTMWEGEANETFHRAFTSDCGQMEVFSEGIDYYISALLSIAARYEQAERMNVQIASERSY